MYKQVAIHEKKLLEVRSEIKKKEFKEKRLDLKVKKAQLRKERE